MISRHNLAVLISANLLRIGLSLILIFQTNWNNIVKIYLLFFPFGLEFIDGVYPGLFKILKPEKGKKCYMYAFGMKMIDLPICFFPWYDILDKIYHLDSNHQVHLLSNHVHQYQNYYLQHYHCQQFDFRLNLNQLLLQLVISK